MNPKSTLTTDQIIAIFRQHDLADDPKITRIAIGFTNEVYAVDNYILKVCIKKENESNFRKEVFLYRLLQDKAPVPHVLVVDHSRTLLDAPYMIYEKLPGDPAASHWHEMNNEQRSQLIQAVCGYLRIIDQTPSEQYAEQLNVDQNFSWQQHIVGELNDKLAVTAEQKLLSPATIHRIGSYIETNRHVLAEQKLGLAFWDVHHDNLLVDSNFKLTGLIDFESVDVYSIDYRLMVVRLMQRYPYLYLSEAVEQYAKVEDYGKLMDWYKEFYPEMFNFEDIDKRIDLYELLDILSKLPDWPTAKVLQERLSSLLGE